MPAVTRVQTMTSAANVAASTQGGGDDSSSSTGSANFMQALDKASESASTSTGAQKTSAKSADANPKSQAVSGKVVKKTKAHAAKAKGADESAPSDAPVNSSTSASDPNATMTAEDASAEVQPDNADQDQAAAATSQDQQQEQSSDADDAELAVYASLKQSTPASQANAGAKKSPVSAGRVDLHRYDPRFDKLNPKPHVTGEPLAKELDAPTETDVSNQQVAEDGDQGSEQVQPAVADFQNLPDKAVKPASDAATDAKQLSVQRQAASSQQPAHRTGPAFGQTIRPPEKLDGSADAKSSNAARFRIVDDPPAVPVSVQGIGADSLVAAIDGKSRVKSADDTADDKDSAPSPIAAPVTPLKLDHVQTPAAVEKSPDARFAEVNHPEIVKVIRGQLLPDGGTLQLRLDPPDLGPLNVTVTMRDGAMSAAFATANDQATRLLSHSLGQLKSVLETAGVTVEKIQVQQAPRSQGGDTSDAQQQQSRDSQQQQDASNRQEQQRREILERMWEKIQLGTTADDVDLVG